MSRFTVIKARYRFNTPAFIGGADQNKPELRTSSFKGILRWWYRAIDARICFSDNDPSPEDKIWGGTNDSAGQSCVWLRVHDKAVKIGNNVRIGSSNFIVGKPLTWQWDKRKFDRFTIGRGKFSKNGIIYLGYPFGLLGNRDRKAIAPGEEFSLSFTIVREHQLDVKDKLAIAASICMFSLLGSCGTRSRRGFGSLQLLDDFQIEGNRQDEWEEIFNSLVSSSPLESPESFSHAVQQVVSVTEMTSGSFREDTLHPHCGQGFQVKFLSSYSDWESALNAAGMKMQEFRQRLEPDYSNLKKFLASPSHGRKAPQRVTFGLPLDFRFSHNRGNLKFTPQRLNFETKRLDRFASPLFIKILRFQNKFYPCFFLMKGAKPGVDIPVQSQSKFGQYYWEWTDKNLVEEFFANL